MLARFLAFAFLAVGCAAPAAEEEVPSVATAAITAECEPAVIVVRHADDARDGIEQCNGSDCLTTNGKQHAALYTEELPKLIAQKNLCAVSQIVTHDPVTLKKNGQAPSTNPYATIAPFASTIGVEITLLDPDTKFDASKRAELTPVAGESIVISWDKEGMKGGLLANMSKDTSNIGYPDRDRVFVFTNAEGGKFDRAEYRQFFQSPFFGSNDASKYFRFQDGYVGSAKKDSTDFPVIAMTICDLDGKNCTKEGATGTTIAKDSPR